MPKNPHANFSPELNPYSGIGAFRFWCQTALPLTYDDSLSYYELLCKVVNYLNNTIADVSTAEGNIDELADAYNSLQAYVNDYFDDIDLEAELRNVLDAMAEDGTLDELLNPLIADQLPGVVEEQIDNVVADQIDSVVAEQIDDSVGEQLPGVIGDSIPDIVTDWLNDNVTPVGSAVVVDASLTISGAAADAKVTGEKIGDNKKAIKLNGNNYQKLNYAYFGTDLFSSGYINSSGGSGNNNKNAKSVYFLAQEIAAIEIPLSYVGKLVWFSSPSSSGYIEHDSHSQDLGAGNLLWITPPINGTYFRIQLAKNDVSVISDSDLINLNNSCIFYATEQKDNRIKIWDDVAKRIYNKRIKYSYNTLEFPIMSGKNIDGSGNAIDDTRYARTALFGVSPGVMYGCECDSNYVLNFKYFNGNAIISNNYVEGSRKRFDFNNNRYYFEIPSTASHMSIVFHRTDYSDISSSDVNTITQSFKLFRSDIPTEDKVYTNTEMTNAFVEYMNEYARKIGMSNSTFTKPSGFADDSISTPEDMLKLGIVVSSISKALDWWSLRDQSFYIGGSHHRTINVVANGYIGWANESEYKKLGGKGGSLTNSGGYPRRAVVAIHKVNNKPVLICLMGKGQWNYDNINICAREVCRMIAESMAGNTPIEGNTLETFVENGGYCGLPIPIESGAYVNSFSPTEILTLPNSVYHNKNDAHITCSTAKILTMLCALELIDDPEEIVTVSGGDLVGGSGTTMYAGDLLTITDAIKIMMMESNNALAETIGRYCGLKLLKVSDSM